MPSLTWDRLSAGRVGLRARPTSFALLFLIAFSAEAGELQRAVGDVKSLAIAPLHWRARQWERFGEGIALVLIVGTADKQIKDAFQRNRSSPTNSFAKAITPFGGGRGLELSALLFGAGKLFHDANASASTIECVTRIASTRNGAMSTTSRGIIARSSMSSIANSSSLSRRKPSVSGMP